MLVAGAAFTAAVLLVAPCGDEHGEVPAARIAPATEEFAPRVAPHPVARERHRAPDPIEVTFGSHNLYDAAPADALDPPDPVERMPTGRVKVTLLQDGRPFEGGHVCFYPAGKYVDVKPWDGVSWREEAYRGLPLYVNLWPRFEPVLGSADGAQQHEEQARGVTGADGTLSLDVRAGVTLVPYVRYAMSGIPLFAQPRVNVAEGGETSITLEAAPKRTIAGRCLDARGEALAGIWIQALAAHAERPVSQMAKSAADGAFELTVWGGDASVRVRAVPPYHERPLDARPPGEDVAPIPVETTVSGVAPGASAFELRLADARVVLLDVVNADEKWADLQVDGLAFDPGAAAWGRLGGPRYRMSAAGSSEPRARGLVALPAADAARPIFLWTNRGTHAVLDPRGAGERMPVQLAQGRRVSLQVRGAIYSDTFRVVAWIPPATEIACILLDRRVESDVLTNDGRWSRDDVPSGAVEFQILREGIVIARASAPTGSHDADVTLVVK
jgi:hypothetical protein